MGKIQIVVFVIAKSPKIKANESGAMVASWSVASRLVHSTPDSTPDRAVLLQTLAGDIVLCSWARQLTPTVPLSTKVYECVLAN